MNAADRIITLATLAIAGVALKKVNVMAKHIDDIHATLADIDKFTTNLADDLDYLAGQVAEGATAEQVAAVKAALGQRAETLRQVAAKVERPVPQPPPPVDVPPVTPDQPTPEGPPPGAAVAGA